MTTFLQLAASDLYRRTGGDFSQVAIVFPGKRASLFFSDCLARLAGRPVWSPAYMSISELFRSLTKLQTGDPVSLICDLHQVFRTVTGSGETLDDFYFWGETLLSDFDDADKNMVDTAALFSNLRDLRRLTASYDFLEEGQREAISQFFRSFSMDKPTELKRRFAAIWDSLGDIYTAYRQQLLSQGIAYEGMLHRIVTETLDIESLPCRTYVFIGFNVLNKVEHTLFTRLHEAGRALFYWDYDTYYTERAPHEAGEFLRRNLRDFPSCLPPAVFDNLRHGKDITFIESPTENAGAHYMTSWVKDHLTEDERETAVVLCDENLLLPVLHALPDCVRSINITMGYPLVQTPVYSFVSLLIRLDTDGYDSGSGRYDFSAAERVLRHPVTLLLSEEAGPLRDRLANAKRLRPLPSELGVDDALRLLFTPADSCLALCRKVAGALQLAGKAYHRRADEAALPRAVAPLYREAVFRAYTVISRFVSLIDGGRLEVRQSTLRRLIDRVLSATSIPFHGEPAEGMQVMGVLETRCLDFRHILMLSVSEGNMPRGESGTSFVPYNLRRAFGMTTIDHKISVYAYYFYRLLQRAESVTMTYTTVTEGMRHGEMSRFMLQLLTEWQHPIRRFKLSSPQLTAPQDDLCVAKGEAIMSELRRTYDLGTNPGAAMLSPTALNTYLDCPLKFFYRYVTRLSAPDEVTGEIDASQFGSIFHHAAEHIYSDLTATGRVVSREALEALLRDDALMERYVDRAFHDILFPDDGEGRAELPRYSGLQVIHSEVALRLVRRLLTIDSRYAPFTLCGAERRTVRSFRAGDMQVKIGGIIDRMDMRGDTLRIVDYKTGGKPGSPADVASLFERDKERESHVFQTFLYASIVSWDIPESVKVKPCLLYIHHAATEEYSPDIKMGGRGAKVTVEDIRPLRDEFMRRLEELLEEIFCPDIPLRQTTVTKRCEYCDFRSLCGR